MATIEISREELIQQLETALKKYELNVDQFLQLDIDELSDYELRDMWLMAKGLLTITK